MSTLIKFLVVLILITGATACGLFFDECAGVSGLGGEFRYTQANAIVMIRNPENDTIRETTSNLIKFGEFGLNIQFSEERISVKNTKTSLISTAYACSPAPAYLKNTIDSVEIYSSVPYQSDLDINMNLAQYFMVAPVYTYSLNVRYNYLKPLEDVADLYEVYGINNPELDYYLIPREVPQEEVLDVSFTIIVHLSDNAGTLETTSRQISLVQ